MPDTLTEAFEAQRDRLRAVAHRVLGSHADAEDVVQEAWLRLSRQDAGTIRNLDGWLTTVVARVSLDMLRSRKSRREEPLDEQMPDKVPATAGSLEGTDPEYEALLADSVGPALLVILERLAPSERLAFVLHDMFAVPFDEIGPIVGRSPSAARQLASRARRRVQGTSELPDADAGRQREIVEAFLAASRNGDFDALLELLDPEVVLRTDGAPLLASTPRETVGASAVATTFSGRARAAQPALIDGEPGLIWAHGGKTMVVFAFAVAGERIVGIEMLAQPDRLAELDAIVLGG